MIIIVDTNIVFSAILNTESVIGDLILNSNKIFNFWTCRYLLTEIDNHWDKLLKISRLEDHDLRESQQIIYKNINFIDEDQIPYTFREQAFKLVKDIDLNDLVFVALNEFQGAILWTGDKVLNNALKANGYSRIVNTGEMVKLRSAIEKGLVK